MAHTVRLAALYALPPAQREAALRDLLDRALGPANGHLAQVRAQVAEFERRYEMSSAELIRRLERDEQVETDDVAEWLFLLQWLDRVNSRGEETPA